MIPHNRPTLDFEEENAAQRVIKSGHVAQGPEVAAFESEFCELLDLPAGHAVALSSGTAALFVALSVLEAKEKKVGFPVYSCSSLRHATAMAGGQECLLEVGMDLPHLLWQQTFEDSFDLAIMPHMYGIPAKIALQSSVKVIEDCAQSIGALAGGYYCGLIGNVGIYSFYATKLMTSGGQGGMLVSRDKSMVDAARDYREFDCRGDRKCRFNFQMTDLQAAIGRTQLKKLPVFIEQRQVIFNRYVSSGLKLLGAEIGDKKNKPVRYRAIWVQPRPRETMARLAEMGITSIIPLEDWELLGLGEHFPNAHWWTQNTLSLPLYPSLTDEEVDYIIKSVNKVRHELNV